MVCVPFHPYAKGVAYLKIIPKVGVEACVPLSPSERDMAYVPFSPSEIGTSQ